jgi:hypothetical protein
VRTFQVFDRQSEMQIPSAGDLQPVVIDSQVDRAAADAVVSVAERVGKGFA